MKTIISLTILISLLGCNQPQRIENKISIVDSLLSQYHIKYTKLPNEMLKAEFKRKYLDTIRLFLTKNLNYRLGNIRVQINEITNRPIGNINAFYVEFRDNSNNTYYTEFDYPISDNTSLAKNPAYKLLKNVPDKTDTIFSFFYLGNLDWDLIYSDNLKISVVPFLKDFNFDSATAANKIVQKLKK